MMIGRHLKVGIPPLQRISKKTLDLSIADRLTYFPFFKGVPLSVSDLLPSRFGTVTLFIQALGIT